MSQSSTVTRSALLMVLVLTMLAPNMIASAQDSRPGDAHWLGRIDCPDFGALTPGILTEGNDFTCAMLTVPQNHNEPDGPVLELFVIELPSRSDTAAPEPIVFLAGGPGVAGHTQLIQFAQHRTGYVASFSQLLESHDVVLIDQRGTGFSQPSLACNDDPGLECDDKSTYPEIDFTVFNTGQNAADIDSLRQALGVDRVHLFGTSYGSWLAQVVMRDYPESVRGVVLNSPVPLQSNLFAGQLIAFQAALDASQRGCSSDPGCANAYPDLATRLEQAVIDLNARPRIVTVEDPVSGRSAEITVDGGMFLFIVYQMHFHGQLVPFVAPLVDSVADGQDRGIAQILPVLLVLRSDLATGFFNSVICQDEVAFTSEAEVRAAAETAGVSQTIIENGSIAALTGIFEVCAAWNLPASPSSANEAVSSDLPTLIVTGVYGPIIPTAYGEELLATLSNATLVESGIAGHDPLSTSGPCGVDTMHSFFLDPQSDLDATCLTEASPDFAPDSLSFRASTRNLWRRQ